MKARGGTRLCPEPRTLSRTAGSPLKLGRGTEPPEEPAQLTPDFRLPASRALKESPFCCLQPPKLRGFVMATLEIAPSANTRRASAQYVSVRTHLIPSSRGARLTAPSHKRVGRLGGVDGCLNEH